MTKELTSREKEFLDYVREQYDHYRSLLEFYGALPHPSTHKKNPDTVTTTRSSLPQPNVNKDISSTAPAPVLSHLPKVMLNRAYTFIDLMVDLISKEDRPMQTQELRQRFQELTGKFVDKKDFASKLAMRDKRTERIRNVQVEHLPLERRYWWGLAGWFTGEHLQEAYQRKIADVLQTNSVKPPIALEQENTFRELN